MTDLTALKAANTARWNAASVTPILVSHVDGIAAKLVAAKARYQTVEAATHVPWAVIAVIHEREASQSWSASLAQGDPWAHESIHVPRGIGPFTSWEDAAIYSLTNCAPYASRNADWTIGGALTELERYNGLGYANGPYDQYTKIHYPPQASPYIWSMTDQYKIGKYPSDGHFDPDAVDHQMGCAALLARMTLMDMTIQDGWQPS